MRFGYKTIMRAPFLLFLLVCVLVFVRDCTAKTCDSLDIRNNVTEFEKLRNCTVVAGFLQVVLFENINEGDFENISFPELKEITGFLLFYRIRGLKSIGKLFPNLSVIRGIELFKDYALVIYDMINLQEVSRFLVFLKFRRSKLGRMMLGNATPHFNDRCGKLGSQCCCSLTVLKVT